MRCQVGTAAALVHHIRYQVLCLRSCWGHHMVAFFLMAAPFVAAHQRGVWPASVLVGASVQVPSAPAEAGQAIVLVPSVLVGPYPASVLALAFGAREASALGLAFAGAAAAAREPAFAAGAADRAD